MFMDQQVESALCGRLARRFGECAAVGRGPIDHHRAVRDLEREIAGLTGVTFAALIPR
jgi:hypothetical protein